MLKDHSADETAAAASARGLDLQAYLNRIGVDRLPRNAGAALRQLHRAHVTSIPFENLDVVLGRKISVDVADLEAKLVRHRRGGYCYEHNLLFAAALEQLGYQVELLVGRVQPAKPGPRTHAVLRVEADARSWLADVGFGGPAQLLEPIPMTLTAPVAQDDWAYRIVDAPFDGGRVLQAAGVKAGSTSTRSRPSRTTPPTTLCTTTTRRTIPAPPSSAASLRRPTEAPSGTDSWEPNSRRSRQSHPSQHNTANSASAKCPMSCTAGSTSISAMRNAGHC